MDSGDFPVVWQVNQPSYWDGSYTKKARTLGSEKAIATAVKSRNSEQHLTETVNYSQEVRSMISSSACGNYRSYSADQKKRAIDMAARDGIQPTARLLQIPPSTIFSWKKKFANTIPSYKKNPGPPAHFPQKEKEICGWILKMREQHLPVTRQDIRYFSHKLINRPDFNASNGWVDRFLRRNGLSLSSKTTTPQHLPEDLNVKTRDFLRHVEKLRHEHDFDADCIINMDETSVYFDMVSGKTVCKNGLRDVVVRSNGAQKRHVTVALAVSASGQALPPMVIFKGKRFPKDITKVPEGVHVEMHPNGLMTDEIMETWIKTVLRPHTQTRPCLLVMDSFTGHTTDRVNHELRGINATPAIIPGGCTSKTQPLDVSLIKPFKVHLCNLWTSYLSDMTERYGNERPSSASRQVLLDLVRDAWHSMAEDVNMIKTSFQLTGITGGARVSETEICPDSYVMQQAALSGDESSFDGFSKEDSPYEPSDDDADPIQMPDSDSE